MALKILSILAISLKTWEQFYKKTLKGNEFRTFRNFDRTTNGVKYKEHSKERTLRKLCNKISNQSDV